MSKSILLILILSCLIEASWLFTVVNMIQDDHHPCPIVTDLIWNVLVDEELNGLLLLHLALWFLKDVLCRQGLSSLVCVK